MITSKQPEADLPKEFVARIRKQFVSDCDQLLDAFNQNAHTSVQLNEAKPSNRFSEEEKIPWYHSGRTLQLRPSFTTDPLLHAGCYYVQESSSMFLYEVLRQLLPLQQGMRFLDLCAAPGGKSILISSYLKNAGVLISNEVVPTRNAVLRENLVKWGCSNAMVSCSAPEKFSTLSHYFDCIVVDAPCSGEGMFRKDQQARNQWSTYNVMMCAQRQQKIIDSVMPCLKPGGLLIYSTCTLAPEENELNCLHWMKQYQLENLSVKIERQWNVDTINHDEIIGYRFLPHKVKGEGLFLCAMRKPEETQVVSFSKSKTIFTDLPDKQMHALKAYFRFENHTLLKDINAIVHASPISADELAMLTGQLYVTMPGVELGAWMKKDFLPAHHAMSAGMMTDKLQTLELNVDDSLQFLRGEALQQSVASGWYAMLAEGQMIGLAKSTGNRLNNHYPKPWRIRMR